MQNFLRVICVYNPFETALSREEKTVYVSDEKTVREYINIYFEEINNKSDICACYNGSYVSHDFIIRHGGLLTFTIVPSGDNQTLRMIAAAAIMVVAVGTGQLYLNSAAVSAMAASGASGAMMAYGSSMLITTAIYAGGMALLNAVMPLESPKQEKSGSRNYSFSGPSNYAKDGDVVPELIGTVRFAPPLIGAYRSLSGNISTVQYINLLYALGDISDGVKILLHEAVPGSLIENGPKIFINNALHANVPVGTVISSLDYNPDSTMQSYKDAGAVSINTYFSNTIHEIDIGKSIPLDIHADDSNVGDPKIAVKNKTYNGFQYAAIPKGSGVLASDVMGEVLGVPQPPTVYTTEKDNTGEISVNFSFVSDPSIINRVAQSDFVKYCWYCALKYKKQGDSQWTARKFAIFSPQWNGTNEVDGGLWFENSEGLDHPDEDLDEQEVTTDYVNGSYYSFSALLPSAGKYDYGVECYALYRFSATKKLDEITYLDGDVTGDNLDFVCLDSFTEYTPDAIETVTIDGSYDINSATVVLYFPNGLIAYRKTGDSAYLTAELNIGIRRGDNGPWIEETVQVRKKTHTPFRYAINFDASRFVSAGNDDEQYYIRAYFLKDYTNSRYIANCLIDYIQLSKFEPFIYPGVATLAMRIKATSKLSGSAPVIEVIAKKDDYKITYGGETYSKKSSNPAWASVYRLMKFGVKEEFINFASFEEWAAFCDENGFECNHYIDTDMTLSDTLDFIGRCGRGAVVRRGAFYDVIIDKVEPAVQLFTDGNIVADSFTYSFMSEEELANVVCVWYFETNIKSGEQKRRAIEVRANNITDPSDIKRIEVEFLGCTSKDLAKKYAIHLLNQTIAVRKTIEFTAAIDAITCEPGNIIMVSKGNTNWTIASGRTERVTPSYFEIDTPLVYDPDYSQYRIRVRKNTPAADVQLDSIIEMAVTPVIPANQEEPFVRFNTNLGLNNADNPDPEFNCFVYSIGVTRASDAAVLDAKKFRVAKIERESNQLFRITASEYFDEMYNDDYVINEIETPTINKDYVSNLVGEVSFSYDGKPYVTLRWSGRSSVFYVYYKSEGAWIKYSEALDTICHVRGVNFTPNEIYTFCVAVVDNPYVGVTVDVLVPEDHVPLKPGEKDTTSDADYLAITGLEILGQGNDHIWKERDLKIRWNEIVYDFEDQIDKPEEGASTSNIDMKELRKFRVELYDKNMNPVKDFIVYEPHFELPFDENKDLFKRSSTSS